MSDWNGPAWKSAPSGKVERRRITAPNAGYISPENAGAYAESLLQAALYGPKAYSPEGLRKPLGALSKDPRDHNAYAAGQRVGLSGLQENLENVKTELKFLVPKVSNQDGVSALNSIISSIQATQDTVDVRERGRVYEEPYKNEPELKDEEKAPWNNPKRARNISFREALSKWVE